MRALAVTDEQVVVLADRLDASAARQLRQAVRNLVHSGGMVLTIDASGVTRVDGGGLAVLVIAQRLASARRCVLVLRDPSQVLREALSAHRLSDSFSL